MEKVATRFFTAEEERGRGVQGDWGGGGGRVQLRRGCEWAAEEAE